MSIEQSDGQTQLTNIHVVEDQAVSQGDIIGSLFVAGEGAHVHFGVVNLGPPSFSIPDIPICPEPHFSREGKDSVLNLLHMVWPSANMCYQY